MSRCDKSVTDSSFPKNRLKTRDFLPNSSGKISQILLANMSFQHFRLGDIALQQPLPPHLAQNQPPTNPSTSAFSAQATSTTPGSANSPSKQPYGSGDTDDGYTLVFSNLEAFHEWRSQEEERQMVEFVKVWCTI